MRKHQRFKFKTKIFLFLMTIVMFTSTLGCILGALLMEEKGIYHLTQEEYLEECYHDDLRKDGNMIASMLIDNQRFSDERIDEVELLCKKRNFASVKIWINDADKILWSWNNEEADFGPSDTYSIFLYSETADEPTLLNVQTIIAKEPSFVKDNYQSAYRLTSFLYTMSFWIFPIAITTLLIAIVCFIYLMHVSGKHPEEEGVRPGWGTSVPLDLLTASAATAFLILLNCIYYLFEDAATLLVLLSIIPMVMLAEAIFIGWSMSFSLRIKLGKWWKNTLLFHLCILLKKVLANAPSKLLLIGNYIPFIFKTILAITTITLLELIAIFSFWYDDPDVLLGWWIIEKLILIPVVLYIAIFLHRLKKGGSALAAGDFTHQTDTRYMIWDLKQHGENLNNIAKGMSLALEERIKSERLKTELITNVSHDIKTPLTSIINYADLLNKEISSDSCEIISAETDSCEAPSIKMDAGKFADIQEYTAVLLRHSKRLKRLIEDLMEASKAATGNIEVNLEPCEASIMLTQAAGEYEQKLESAGLTIVTKQPEQPIHIMADGRRLWRIFDNLLNNICKYAQAGTRVYLTLEKQEKFAVITFKNISRDALDVSSDELMERFVRGDASRHTEGNGLGLSIAKSLTELQNGTMNLDIDGDLFKVTLRFPVIH